MLELVPTKTSPRPFPADSMPGGTAELQLLHRSYLFGDAVGTISELLAGEPGLNSILTEAVKPLQAAFGAPLVLKAWIQRADDERLLRVAVQVPKDFEGDPEAALSSFDREWWLSNCHRSGAVVFDYEKSDVL